MGRYPQLVLHWFLKQERCGKLMIIVFIYVVVQFYPWFKFYFLLFLGIVMYDNEFETKEIKI